MKAYQSILVASNLRPESENIVNKAAELSTQWGAQLSIVHIVEISPIYFGGSEFALPIESNLEEMMLEQAKKSLTVQAARLSIPENRQFIEKGLTAYKLNEIVISIHADLLVIGHHEQHGLALLLGSTANSLLHEMPCDVLAVRV